jgi:hypothetical protein
LSQLNQITTQSRGATCSSARGLRANTGATKEIARYESLQFRTNSMLVSMSNVNNVDCHVALVRSVESGLATEANVERTFSHSGHLLEPLRQRMGPETVCLFMFLHENMDFWPSDRDLMRAYWYKHYGRETPVPFHFLDGRI